MENKFEQAINQQAQKDSLIFTGENITLAQAMNKLKEELLKDKELNSMYWDSWKASIAMAFVDEYYKNYDKLGKSIDPNSIHEIANTAAENFLNMLCK